MQPCQFDQSSRISSCTLVRLINRTNTVMRFYQVLPIRRSTAVCFLSGSSNRKFFSRSEKNHLQCRCFSFAHRLGRVLSWDYRETNPSEQSGPAVPPPSADSTVRQSLTPIYGERSSASFGDLPFCTVPKAPCAKKSRHCAFAPCRFSAFIPLPPQAYFPVSLSSNAITIATRFSCLPPSYSASKN